MIKNLPPKESEEDVKKYLENLMKDNKIEVKKVVFSYNIGTLL